MTLKKNLSNYVNILLYAQILKLVSGKYFSNKFYLFGIFFVNY